MVDKPKLPKYCFIKNGKIWTRLKREDGKWQNRPTPYAPHQVADAAAAVAIALRDIGRKCDLIERGDPVAGSVRDYVKQWIAERERRGIGAVAIERGRMDKYVLPAIGSLPVEQVRPRHIRDIVRDLRQRTGDERLAPRTVLAIFRMVHTMFESAIVDELIQSNPCKVKRGELPKKIDSDPEWRSQATYTVREVERLISDPIIPPERRVMYALKALAGMRHGEAAALLWRHIDREAEPLARIHVIQAYDSIKCVVKSTKTEETRAVPMHPTLAKILAAWKVEHWERIYGRKPTDDDYVVPTRTMNPINAADAGHAKDDDFSALGLRVEAGKHRTRGGHDLRSWYQTRMIEDGADSLIVRRTTHAAPKGVEGGYERFSWATICREIAKLRVEVLGGKVLELVPERLPAEKKAGARWTSVVTPKGLEISKRALARDNASKKMPEIAELSRIDEAPVTIRERHSGTRSLLAIERAIRDGDAPRALRLLAHVRELGLELPEVTRAMVEDEQVPTDELVVEPLRTSK